MQLEILDNKQIGDDKGCFLCKTSLEDYLNSAGEDFDKYSIQRNIVNNPYLDDIATTVFNMKHIPVITLVVTKEDMLYEEGKPLRVDSFHILDGLQRTWRLRTLKKYVDWLKKMYPTISDLKKMTENSLRSLSVDTRKEIIGLGMSDLKRAQDIARQIVDIGSYDKILQSFSENRQWFEVWYGLSQEEIINKMLLLNAGHKTMSGKHQIELLYLNWFDTFSGVTGVKIRRDKDIKSSVVFVQERQVKEYRFSDLVMATLAFENGKVNDIQSTIVMKSYENIEDKPLPVEQSYYMSLIAFIADVDVILYKKYGKIGIEWFGRANIMEAFCAAAGAWYKNRTLDKPIDEALNEKKKDIEVNVEGLNIYKFNEAKNMLDATKTSIGQRMKKIVFQATYEFLETGVSIDWDKAFNM